MKDRKSLTQNVDNEMNDILGDIEAEFEDFPNDG